MTNDDIKRINVGTIGHVDHGRTTLTAALSSLARVEVIDASETFDIAQFEEITISSFEIKALIDHPTIEPQGKSKHKKKGRNRRQW